MEQAIGMKIELQSAQIGNCNGKFFRLIIGVRSPRRPLFKNEKNMVGTINGTEIGFKMF